MTKFPLDWGTGADHALVMAGACRACRNHFDVYLRTREPEAERSVYAIGTNLLKSGKVRQGPRQEFISLIVQTLDGMPDTCFICDAAYERGDE